MLKKALANTVDCGGGSQARSKSGVEPQDMGEDLRSSGEGLRGFKSRPPHFSRNPPPHTIFICVIIENFRLRIEYVSENSAFQRERGKGQ